MKDGGPLWGDTQVLKLAPSWSWASNRSAIWYQNPSSPYLNVVQKVIYVAHVTFFALPVSPRKRVGWMLVLTTEDSIGEVNAYVGTAWYTSEKGDHEAFPIGPDEAKIQEFMKISMSKNVILTPDVEPKQRKSLVCLLLKRILGDEEDSHIFLGTGNPAERTTITGFGIVCEPVDPSNMRFRRIGYFHDVVSHKSLRPLADHKTKAFPEVSERKMDSETLGIDQKMQFEFDYLIHVGSRRGVDDVSRHIYSRASTGDGDERGASGRYHSLLGMQTVGFDTDDPMQRGLRNLVQKLTLSKGECR
jgi:hypothetical protein